MATKIQLRRDTAANWTSSNPTLAQGEPGLETDTGKMKLGDGSTAWTGLAYQAAANIVDGTIVNADVNASAAIAGTKIAPDFGSQSVTTTGTSTAASFIPTSSTAPSNGVYLPAANSVAISCNGNGKLSVDADGRVVVGTPGASGAAILQVQTPTSLPTSSDAGVRITNTSTKVYPTTANYQVTAGLNQNIELGSAQVVSSGSSGVYGTNIILTKSAGNTQDSRLFYYGFYQNFSWNDQNTCANYTGLTDLFTYLGCDANSVTSSLFLADTVILRPADTKTQTVTQVASNVLRIAPQATGTVNVGTWNSRNPSLLFVNLTAGTKTTNITNATFYDTNSLWGANGTAGTVNATITNLYGLRLRPPASSTGITIANNWGLYQEWSSAKNWFAGASNQFPNITTTASGANAFLDSADSNRLYLSTSSLAYKRDIENLDSNLADQILNLRPVWYRSKCDSDFQDWSWYGLIAEEVAEIDPRFVHYGYQKDAYEIVEAKETVALSQDDPRRKEGITFEEITRQVRQLKADAQKVPNGVAYDRLVVPLLDIIKRQKSQLESIEARLAALEAA